jgi:hypothetical protein
MASEARHENALETRIRLLRDLEVRVAGVPEREVTPHTLRLLAAIRELLMEAEAELEHQR